MIKSKNLEFFGLLNIRPFFSVWFNDVTSQVANTMFLLTLQWWVFLGTRSPLNLGIILVLDYAPQLIFNPVSGYFSDRLERRKILLYINLLQGTIVLPLLIADYEHFLNITLLYSVFFTSSLLSVFSGNARSSSVPDTVPRERLVGASSFMQSSRGISGVVGFLLGGVVVYYSGIITALSFFVILKVLSAMVTTVFKFSSKGNLSAKNKFSSSIKDAAAFITTHKIVLTLILLAAIWGFFYAPLQALLPIYVTRYPDYSSELYGILRGFMSAGVVIGATITGMWNPKGRVGARMLSMAALSGMFITILFLSPYFLLSIVIILMIGFFDTIVDSLAFSILFAEIPSDYRGRVFSLIMTVTMSVSIVGIFVGSSLAQLIGASKFFMYGGVIIFLFSILLYSTGIRNAHISS